MPDIPRLSTPWIPYSETRWRAVPSLKRARDKVGRGLYAQHQPTTLKCKGVMHMIETKRNVDGCVTIGLEDLQAMIEQAASKGAAKA